MQFIAGVGLDEVLAALLRLHAGPVGRARPPTCLARPAWPTTWRRRLLAGRCEPPAADATVVFRPQEMEVPTPSATHFTDGASGARAGRARWHYERSVALLGVQSAQALDHAHRQGVLHRDVKPSNLLVDGRGTVWVSDFGLAKTDDQEDLTHTGELLGTLRYMPPEAFEGKADARSDVYSLGLTLYELLAFRPAFDAADRAMLVRQVMAADPPRCALNPETPNDLATIVHKAIEREPSHRYSSAGELAEDLQRFADDQPIRARRMSLPERAFRWPAQPNRRGAVGGRAGRLARRDRRFDLLRRGGRARAEREEIAATAARTAEGEARRARRHSDMQAARLALKEALRKAEAGAVDVGLYGLIEALRLAPRDAEAEDFRRAVRLNFAAWGRQLPTMRYALALGVAKDQKGTWVRPIGPEGKTFALFVPGRRWELRETATGRLIGSPRVMPVEERPLALSLDGELLLTGIDKKGGHWFVQLRRLADGSPAGPVVSVPRLGERSAHPGSQSFVLSPRWALTGNADTPDADTDPPRFWDMQSGKAYPLKLARGLPTSRLVLSPNGKGLVFVVRSGEEHFRGADWSATAHDVETGLPAALPLQLVRGDDPHVDWEGRSILSIHGDESAVPQLGDGSVRWWDTTALRLLDLWQPRRKSWFSSLLPAGQTLAAYGRDNRVRLFDLDTGLQRGGDLHAPGIPKIDETPGGVYPGEPVLLTNHQDGLLRAWAPVRCGRRRRRRPRRASASRR